MERPGLTVDRMEETDEWDGGSVFSAVRDGRDDGGGGGEDVGNGNAGVTSAENITKERNKEGEGFFYLWHIFH